MIAEIFVLAVAAMFWPFLLVVDIVALRTSRPVAILTGYLIGGYVATIGLGLALVYALRSTSLVDRSTKTSTNIGVDLAVGLLAVAAAFIVWRGRNHSGRSSSTKPSASGPNRMERLVAKGALLAFVVGIATDIVPGVFPFIAMKDIADLKGSVLATILLIIGFYVVMFTFIEVPLVAFVVAPTRTKTVVDSFNVWLERNARAIAAGALLVFGLLEIAHGTVAAFR